jgi:hypothetical protein
MVLATAGCTTPYAGGLVRSSAQAIEIAKKVCAEGTFPQAKWITSFNRDADRTYWGMARNTDGWNDAYTSIDASNGHATPCEYVEN